jgi:hypothetical protein
MSFKRRGQSKKQNNITPTEGSDIAVTINLDCVRRKGKNKTDEKIQGVWMEQNVINSVSEVTRTLCTIT